jgi:hypothetical protein
MRVEVLVLSGENGARNHRRDVLVFADPTVLGGHLHERLAIRIVNVADPREAGADEWFQVRQIRAVKIDAIETNPDESGRYECCRKQKPGGWLTPSQRGVAAATHSANRHNLSASQDAPEPVENNTDPSPS